MLLYFSFKIVLPLYICIAIGTCPGDQLCFLNSFGPIYCLTFQATIMLLLWHLSLTSCFGATSLRTPMCLSVFSGCTIVSQCVGPPEVDQNRTRIIHQTFSPNEDTPPIRDRTGTVISPPPHPPTRYLRFRLFAVASSSISFFSSPIPPHSDLFRMLSSDPPQTSDSIAPLKLWKRFFLPELTAHLDPPPRPWRLLMIS